MKRLCAIVAATAILLSGALCPAAENTPAGCGIFRGGNLFAVVSKENMKLYLYAPDGTVVRSYGIACGKNVGDKRCEGDYRTPEGVFTVEQIQNARKWKHDFGDGKGVIRGAYGPFFVRLLTPGHSGIGIHGTHDALSIGTRATEGCIRLANEDIYEFATRFAYVGMPVVILPSGKGFARDIPPAE